MEGVAGVDEAGRGPLAGPVVAAAVILPNNYDLPGLTDSKRLSERKRELLFDAIVEQAQSYAIAEASVEEIDALNILQATLLAMRRAVQGLDTTPCEVWVDGNCLPGGLPCPARALVKGDQLCPAISAASILAKVTRDRMLVAWAKRYPQYGFDSHKGYGTQAHLEALKRYGPTPWHRLSFAPVRRVVEVG